MQFLLKSTSGLPVSANHVISEMAYDENPKNMKMKQRIELENINDLISFINDLSERKTGREITINRSKRSGDYYITVKDE
jgi:uncharacterized FlaG/YvyC family protein